MKTYEEVCEEWLKGCSCADSGKPEQCEECTAAFLESDKRIWASRIINKNLLERLKDYIEEIEQLVDWDRGLGRSTEKMISEGDMPDLYAEILREIEKQK